MRNNQAREVLINNFFNDDPKLSNPECLVSNFFNEDYRLKFKHSGLFKFKSPSKIVNYIVRTCIVRNIEKN